MQQTIQYIPIGTRVEVELYFTDEPTTGFGRGVIVDLEVRPEDPEDPSYQVEIDGQHRLPPPFSKGDEGRRRWTAWEFVRPLSLLELMAEAAAND